MLLISDCNSDGDLEGFPVWDRNSVSIENNSNMGMGDANAAKKNSSEEDKGNSALILVDHEAEKITEYGNPPEMVSKEEVSWLKKEVSWSKDEALGIC